MSLFDLQQVGLISHAFRPLSLIRWPQPAKKEKIRIGIEIGIDTGDIRHILLMKDIKPSVSGYSKMQTVFVLYRLWGVSSVGRASDLHQVTICVANRCSERSEDAFCEAESKLRRSFAIMLCMIGTSRRPQVRSLYAPLYADLTQPGECFPYKEEVGSSILSVGTGPLV